MPSSPLETAPWNPGILGADRTKDVLDKTCLTDKLSRGIVINIAGINGMYGGLRIPRGSPLAPGTGPVKPIKSMSSPRVVPEEAVANGNAQWRKLGRHSCVTVLNKDRTCVFALPPVGESSAWMCWASTLAILCRTGQMGEGSFWNLLSQGWVLSLPRGAERPLPNCLGRLFCSCWPEDQLSL